MNKTDYFGIDLPKDSTYECNFIGGNDDVSYFLGSNDVNVDNVKLKVFGDLYSFRENDNPLILYSFDSNSMCLSTYQPTEVSTQLSPFRKFNVELEKNEKDQFEITINTKKNHKLLKVILYPV